ncbi:MAG: glycoside hydrolase family 127 protein [Tannerella sp.]|nr:glycoside hydrolase family 127 protein [Tannerella sp.]
MQHEGKIKIANAIPVKVMSFDLKDVRLLDSPFKENMERESQWLLSLSANQLVHTFRVNAGIQSSSQGALGGWERLDVELRGHTTGHVLSGLALMYASTGNPVYKNKGDSIVTALAEVQQVLNQDGYLSAYPQYFIDRNIAGKGVWAPWYTLHKIFAGLMDMYLYTDNQQALYVVTKMGMWAYTKLSPLSEEQLTVMLKNEFGGIGETLYNLYSITGIPEIKTVAQKFYHKAIMEPLANEQDNLATMHANTYIPKIIGEARCYELFGGNKEKTIAHFFWNTVIRHQTYATGGNSSKEHFIEADQVSKYLTGYTQESCNTYNMLKLTRHLFCWNPDPLFADYYETALYNHILGQQDPATGMISYFLPLLPGAHKVYSTPENSFWCCVGSGFENHAKYGEAIYYHDDNGLYVNLFIPSELTWKSKDIGIRQETKFPEEETVSLTIDSKAPVNMPIHLRYPLWANQVTVKINGKKIKVKQTPGSYIVLDRKWNPGDKIEAVFSMQLRLVAANDNPDKVAFAYGPLILAAPMGTEGMIPPAPYSNPHLHNDYYTYDYHVPDNITEKLRIDKDNIGQFIKPVNGKALTFQVVDTNIQLEPIYKIHRQRYVTYWDTNK